MASIKAIGAIALTLMIAVPILLGYALATEDVESTVWVQDSTANITDTLNNTETPYFTSYIAPQNNKSLLQSQYYSGGGVTEWHLVAPAYNSISSNYSSLPEYTTSTDSFSLSADASGTVSMSSGGTSSVGSSDSGAVQTLTEYPVMRISVSTSSASIHWNVVLDNQHLGGYHTLILIKNGADTWEAIYNGQNYGTISDWRYETDATGTLTWEGKDYTNVNVQNTDITFTTGGRSSVELVGDETTYLSVPTIATITKTASDVVVINDTTYTQVTTFKFTGYLGEASQTYEYETAVAGGYADASAGWKLPTVSGAATTDWWTNNQLNDTVRMMISFPSSGYAYLGPAEDTSSGFTITLHYDGTDTYVNDTNLGKYTKLMVVMDTEKAVVYGVNEWPTLGASPTTYNSVEVDYTDLDPFLYVKLQSTTAEVSYRVDYCEIVAGYYPSIKNKTFSPAYLYPDQSAIVTIKSVAVYGDALRIVLSPQFNLSYPVTDGKITVNDTVMSVRGLQIKWIVDENGKWSVYFNNETAISGVNNPYPVSFRGEWSLTASLSSLSQQTSTHMEWQPGQFAFDKEDFVACGLIVVGACLVGLGMYGGRSGTKMGILLMVCGGGALVYLTLI